jgi:hypothetical protein
MRTTNILRLAVIALAAVAACGGDDSSSGSTAGGTAGSGGTGSGGGVVAQPVMVSGTVVDFQGDAPITGSATVSTAGLSPPPTISVTGANFEITGVPPFSVFQLLSGAPPSYRSTYNIATEVQNMDVTGVQARVVAETYLSGLETAFNVTIVPGTGIVIARAVDEAGNPLAGVLDTAFSVNNAPPPAPPRFLDANLAPDPALTVTSASGYVVFYNIPEGLVTFGSAPNSGVTIVGATSPVAATAVTLAEVRVTPGGPVLPMNVSFSGDVVPIFSRRGCDNCHSGNAVGADLGDLTLNGSDNKIFAELTQEISPSYNKTRVDLVNPAQSLVLTLPSFEQPADPHPNATFSSPADEDYLILLAWITEGAEQN